MSGGNFTPRYAVVAETRRRWSEAEKRSIVAEAERPGTNISAVARRHGIKPSLLFRWRRMARASETAGPAFVPVAFISPPACAEPATPESATAPSFSSLSSASLRCSADDRIEIELTNGQFVRFGAGIDTDALKRVLDLLDHPTSSSEAVGRKQIR